MNFHPSFHHNSSCCSSLSFSISEHFYNENQNSNVHGIYSCSLNCSRSPCMTGFLKVDSQTLTSSIVSSHSSSDCFYSFELRSLVLIPKAILQALPSPLIQISLILIPKYHLHILSVCLAVAVSSNNCNPLKEVISYESFRTV